MGRRLPPPLGDEAGATEREFNELMAEGDRLDAQVRNVASWFGHVTFWAAALIAAWRMLT